MFGVLVDLELVVVCAFPDGLDFLGRLTWQDWPGIWSLGHHLATAQIFVGCGSVADR